MIVLRCVSIKGSPVVCLASILKAMGEGYRPGDAVTMRFADGDDYGGTVTAVEDGTGKKGSRGAQPLWEGVTLRWDTGGAVRF